MSLSIKQSIFYNTTCHSDCDCLYRLRSRSHFAGKISFILFHKIRNGQCCISDCICKVPFELNSVSELVWINCNGFTLRIDVVDRDPLTRRASFLISPQHTRKLVVIEFERNFNCCVLSFILNICRGCKYTNS